MSEMKGLRKRVDYSALLVVDDKHYKTVAELCAEYNLGYRTVLDQLKRGRSGDEIVRSMLELPNIPKKSRGNRKIVYAGKEYASAAEACRQLGIKKDRVYNLLRQGIPAKEALAKALELQAKADGKTDGRSISSGSTGDPCVIDGVSFPSRRAACRAFGLSYPSVMSRTQRHPEMSFEDALLYGARKWRYIKPVQQISVPAREQRSSSYSYNSLNGDEPALPLLLELEELLIANDYGSAEDFRIEWDTAPERWVLETDIYLHPPKGRKELDICYERTSPSFVQSFQFSIPLLVLPQFCTGDLQALCQCQAVINQLHSEFSGVTLYILDRTIRANGLYITSGQSFSGRQFLYALHRFLGTAREMYRRLTEALDCNE